MEEKIIKVLCSYLDCKVAIRTDGTLTTSGRVALRKLSGLLDELDLNKGEVRDAIRFLFANIKD